MFRQWDATPPVFFYGYRPPNRDCLPLLAQAASLKQAREKITTENPGFFGLQPCKRRIAMDWFGKQD